MRRSRLMWQFIFLAGITAVLIVLINALFFRHFRALVPNIEEDWPISVLIVSVMAIGASLAGLVSVYLASRRVRRILRGFDELRQGKYPHLVTEGSDEVAELMRSFNLMVEELRSRDEKLKSWLGHRETEVVRLAQTLEEERERLGTVLDSIGDGVIVLDSEGQVVMANRKVSEVFGIPLEMVLRADLSRLIEQVRHRLVKPKEVEQKVRELLRNPSLVDEITLELDQPGGQAIRLYCAPVRGADGKLLGRIATSLDLGKERELDRLKTEFLSTVSHELRTPLTSVKGALGLIRGGAAGPISADIRELLEIALTNTDRLIRVINDILDIFQLERGQARMRPVAMTLGRSVTHAVRTVADVAALRKVTVQTRLEKELPQVHADPKRVQQVLVNLLSNAIKFSRPDSKVLVTARPDGDRVVIAVQDFGRGINPSFLERLFQKFEHEQESLTRESQGAGLGLAICRHIIRAHGGEIWAESKEGKGSTFYFTLPVVESGAVEEGTRRRVVRQTLQEPRLVLVIDDDQDVARVISYIFESQGHRVITVHNGREAVEMARKHRPDLLTLDIKMPDMDGYSVIQTLRGSEETRKIPIICISIETDSGTALSRGADFYLEKPLDIDKLREVADRALAGH